MHPPVIWVCFKLETSSAAERAAHARINKHVMHLYMHNNAQKHNCDYGWREIVIYSGAHNQPHVFHRQTANFGASVGEN
jgi:hypothetical protein